jgi:transposase
MALPSIVQPESDSRAAGSDMWKAQLKVIAKQAPKAVQVLDRFHIMQTMNKAIDEVRAGETRQMRTDGYEPPTRPKMASWLPDSSTARSRSCPASSTQARVGHLPQDLSLP